MAIPNYVEQVLKKKKCIRRSKRCQHRYASLNAKVTPRRIPRSSPAGDSGGFQQVQPQKRGTRSSSNEIVRHGATATDSL